MITIGCNAFNGTAIRSFSIPSNLKILREGAFCSCRKLKKVVISNDSKLKSIQKEVFANISIESFVVPDRVDEVGYDAFANCKKL